MKKQLLVSFALLAALASHSYAQTDKDPRRDNKTPTIPEQQQSGWDIAYDQLYGKLKGADVTRSTEGVSISFRDNVLFDSESATIRNEAKDDLNTIAKAIKDHSSKKVRVNGRADATGSPGYNKKLSMQRAEAVSAYLVAQGVSEKSLKEKAYGEKNPVANNSTPEGRQQNRRVDILLLN